MLRGLLSRILGTFRRHWLDEEFDEEVREHLDMLTERLIHRGMEPTEAFYAARRQFGGATQLKQDRSLRRGSPLPSQLSYPDFFDFRKDNRVFAHLVSYRDAPFTLTDTQPAIQVVGAIVSWDLFPLLGIQPERGRGFRPEEEQPGTHVAVLSHALWTNRFGRDERILGKVIPINGAAFTAVGVAPAGFQFPLDVPGDQRGAQMLDAIGRLKPRISAEQARAAARGGFWPREWSELSSRCYVG